MKKKSKTGRVRITVNLPSELLPVLQSQEGRSLSTKLVGLVQAAKGRSGP